MVKKLLFSTILIILFFCKNGWAAFNEIGVGARAIGIGDAFVAIADDGNAVNYNAGGLGRIENIYIGLTKTMEFAGLINYNHVALILPLGKIGTLGGSFGVLSENSGVYEEKEFILSYGKSFSLFSTGISLKSLGTNFDKNIESIQNNPYFAKTSANALSMGWGLLVEPVNGLSIGLSLDNLLPADISISEKEEDKIPMKFGLGLAYNLEAISSAAQQKTMQELFSRTQGAIGFILRNGNLGFNIGVEVGVHKSFIIRGGYTTESGVNNSATVSLGGSFILPIQSVGVRLDYALQMLMNDLQDNTSHHISTNIFF